MTTGQKIKNIRKNKGISQYKLAELTKTLNQSQLSKIEKGDRKVTDKDLISIARALEITAAELLC